MIIINDLKVSFDGRDVIDGVTLDVERGSTLVVLGKNGSGKSVLLKSVAGLIPGYDGSITVDGVEVHDFSLVRQEGRAVPSVAYVFQKGGLFDSFNVFDNVAFGLRRKKVPEDTIADIVNRSLARVGLAGSEAKLPSELSGGMQKRVGLARAVCLEPSVILYDDPTAGLDPVLSDSIADLVLEIKRMAESTSIVVTHDLTVTKKIADRVALLYEGHIVYQGTCDDFFRADDPFARQFISGDIEGPIDIY